MDQGGRIQDINGSIPCNALIRPEGKVRNFGIVVAPVNTNKGWEEDWIMSNIYLIM